MNPRTLKYLKKSEPTFPDFPTAYYSILDKLAKNPNNREVPRDLLETRAGAIAARIVQMESRKTEVDSVEVVSSREETAKRIEIETSTNFVEWVA